MSKFPGGRRGTGWRAALAAGCAMAAAGQFLLGGWVLSTAAAATTGSRLAAVISVPLHASQPLHANQLLAGLVRVDGDGDGDGSDDPPSDPPSDDPTDPGTPTDTPTQDPPTSDPPVVPDSPTPNQPQSVAGIKIGASVADLTDDYWNGATSTSMTIYLTNTGNIDEQAHVTYGLPNGVTDRGSPDCSHGVCDVTVTAGASGVLLKVNLTVSPQAWKQAPLRAGVSVHATADGGLTASDSTTWDVNFPPGPPVNGLTLTAEDVPLGSPLSTGGQLVAHFTNTGAVAGNGELQVVTPAGVAVTGFPADCVSHRQVSANTQSCQLGSVAAGTAHRVAFVLTISAAARADAPVVGVLRASLSPVGLDPVTTQTSWQITAAPHSPGAVAAQGVLPSPSPTPSATTSPTPDATDGPLDVVTGYASAAVQVVGWRIVVTSMVMLILVLLGLTLGLRRRRFRPVPLFPAPLPAGPRPDRADLTGPAGGSNGSGSNGSGRTGSRDTGGGDTGGDRRGEQGGSDTGGKIRKVEGAPLPQRHASNPPDVSLATRSLADTPPPAAPQPVAATAAPATAAPQPRAGGTAPLDYGSRDDQPDETDRTGRIPTIGTPVMPSPFTGTGYSPAPAAAHDHDGE